MALFKNTNGDKPKRKKWKNPLPAPKKITAADITSDKTKRRVAIGAIVLIFLGALGLFYAGNWRANQIGEQVDAVNDKVTALEGEVDKLSGQKASTDTDISKTANSAANAGNKVAELQNKYNGYNLETQGDSVKSNALALDAYFGDNDKNARTPWYTKQASDVATTWECESTYSFEGNTANVIWLCKDGSGQIYAYTTAVYDVASRTFSNVSRKQTALGHAHVQATAENEYKTKLDETIKQIQEKSGDDSKENKFTPEQQQEINDARQRAREEQMKNNN